MARWAGRLACVRWAAGDPIRPSRHGTVYLRGFRHSALRPGRPGGRRPRRARRAPLALPYLATVSTDLWLGTVTTLLGAALGGSISFIVSRQQIKSAWIQRQADAAEERNRRSEDRRFTA